MAHFRGTVKGQRKEVSRLGTARSGMMVEAQSWEGKVMVYAYAEDGCNHVRISFAPHHGHGVTCLLYDGPIAPTANDLPKYALGGRHHG